MNHPIVESSGGITLVGGAPVSQGLFRMAIQRAPVLVAADSGADRCLKMGMVPEAVIGDMDSISASGRERLAGHVHAIAEQDSTDFDKALRSIKARFVLAIGFMGARADHELAAYNVLVRRTGNCLMLGAQDVVFHLPERFSVEMEPADRFSLFPMRAVEGQSVGLEWPIDGLVMTPDGRTGTSNRVRKGRVDLHLSGPGMLAILPRRRLDRVLQALLG